MKRRRSTQPSFLWTNKGTITPVQAMQDLGCMRLGARIWDLRAAGHNITRRMVSSKNRYGEATAFAEYKLEV